MNKKDFKIFTIRDKFTPEEILDGPNCISDIIWNLLPTFRNNSFILIDNRPVIFKEIKKTRMYKVQHFLENPPYPRLVNNKPTITVEIWNYLQLLGLITSLSSNLRNQLRTWYHITRKPKVLIQNINLVCPYPRTFINPLWKTRKKTEATRSIWCREKDCEIEVLRWEEIYSKLVECSNSSKLRNFQKDTDLSTISMKETKTLVNPSLLDLWRNKQVLDIHRALATLWKT